MTVISCSRQILAPRHVADSLSLIKFGSADRRLVSEGWVAAYLPSQCNRLRLWAVLSRGVHMRVSMPAGMARVNPLILAIQANYSEDPDIEYELPDMIQSLLWACCSPDDFGPPEVSPLGEALRSGCDMSLSLLFCCNTEPTRPEGKIVATTQSSWRYRRIQQRTYIAYCSTKPIQDRERQCLLRGRVWRQAQNPTSPHYARGCGFSS